MLTTDAPHKGSSSLEVQSKEDLKRKKKPRSKLTRPRFANDPQDIINVYLSKCK